MSRRTMWRVQAHWTVGGEERSYQPSYVTSQRAARRAVRSAKRTLAHFPTLWMSVDEVDRSTAEAAIAAAEARRAAAPQQPVHLYGADRSAALCGATREGDGAFILMEVDTLALSSSPKCPDCLELAGVDEAGMPYGPTTDAT
ncbi:MAG: hypothetical protein H6513_14835 [Acidimicrobiaceae bacterium]|nr:hypothetical protein [Ilumatobacter sp.]MCB9381958.1 hypothetical protein [Acidimicrobiaceae bacterium]MCO5329939.1 hypothetical protein [Ilumatobacteraceae bacterium]